MAWLYKEIPQEIIETLESLYLENMSQEGGINNGTWRLQTCESPLGDSSSYDKVLSYSKALLDSHKNPSGALLGCGMKTFFNKILLFSIVPHYQLTQLILLSRQVL